jgi:hypothetical protein
VLGEIRCGLPIIPFKIHGRVCIYEYVCTLCRCFPQLSSGSYAHNRSSACQCRLPDSRRSFSLCACPPTPTVMNLNSASATSHTKLRTLRGLIWRNGFRSARLTRDRRMRAVYVGHMGCGLEGAGGWPHPHQNPRLSRPKARGTDLVDWGDHPQAGLSRYALAATPPRINQTA